MKNFIAKILLFLFITVAIFCAAAIFIPAAKTQYLYAIRPKYNRLDTLSAPRLVLVGGSNVAFGMESGILHDSLKMNVQNTALHAGIGLKLIMSQVSKRLQKGDVVVLMPEYQHFFTDAYGNEEALPQAIMYTQYESLKDMNLRQWINLLTGVPQAVIVNIQTLISPLNRKNVYCSMSFNEYGDVDAHYGLASKPWEPMIIQGDIDTDYIEYFSSEIAALREKEMTVYIFPPALAQSTYDKNKEKIQSLTTALQSRGLAFQLPPEAMLQPDSLTFDTPYHMSFTAAHDNTLRILHRLKELDFTNNQ